MGFRIINGQAYPIGNFQLPEQNINYKNNDNKTNFNDILQNEIKDTCFLDLFAGSEEIGLEAVSRGAQKAILCEKSKEAIEIIKKNVQKTHLEEKIEINSMDFIDFIKNKLQEKPDFIYIDPPYESDYAIKAIKELLRTEKLKLNSTLIIETDKEQELIEQISDLPIMAIDHRRYGRAHLIFLQKYQSDRKG